MDPQRRKPCVIVVCGLMFLPANIACNGIDGLRGNDVKPTPSPTRENICAGTTDENSAVVPVTFWQDVKPLFDARCNHCHHAGGVAPFGLDTYAEASVLAPLVYDAVCDQSMPPWQPHPSCNQYQYNHELSKEQIALVRDWVKGGLLAGDPDQPPSPDRLVDFVGGELSRIDAVLPIAEAYIPNGANLDDYRCFIVPLQDLAGDAATSLQQDMFLTGFGMIPDVEPMLHHAVLFAIDDKKEQERILQQDQDDERAGFSCFGGPLRAQRDEQLIDLAGEGLQAVPSVTRIDPPPVVGVWTPGTTGADFPTGTGVRLTQGTMLVVQIHYGFQSVAPQPDQSAVALKLDAQVDREAVYMPVYDVAWTTDNHANDQFVIPANQNDAVQILSKSVHTLAAQTQKQREQSGQHNATAHQGWQKIVEADALQIYGVLPQLYQRGTRIRVAMEYQNDTGCLVDIDRWDFHWRSLYLLQTPLRVEASDRVRLECHWNNAAGFTPPHSDPLQNPRDLRWGEGRDDEMCLAFLYVAPASL